MSPITALTIMVLAECLLVLVVVVVLLLRKIAQLKQALDDPAQEGEAEAVTQMNVRQGIEHLIHETQEFLALDETGKVGNELLSEGQASLLLKRMAYLRAEQNSLTGNDRVQTQWTQLYGELGPLLTAPEPPPDDGAASKKLLEKSRRILEGMQEMMSGYMNTVEELVKALPGLADGTLQLADMQQKLSRLNGFRGNLLGKLDELEDFNTSDLAAESETVVNDESEGSGSKINKLRSLFKQHHGTIDKLKEAVADEKLTPEMLREIEGQLGDIDTASKELRLCMDMMKLEQVRKIEVKLSGPSPAKERLFDTIDEQTLHHH